MNLFLACSLYDQPARDRFLMHLAPLVRANGLNLWHPGLVHAGEDPVTAINRELDDAHLVVVLLTPAFLADHDALIRKIAEMRIWTLFVLTRPCAWRMQIGSTSMMVLPRDRKPISQWRDRDAGWAEVATEVSSLLNSNAAVLHGGLNGRGLLLSWLDKGTRSFVQGFLLVITGSVLVIAVVLGVYHLLHSY